MNHIELENIEEENVNHKYINMAGTSKYEAICKGLGVDPEHVRVVVPTPTNIPEITRILREEIAYRGVSVVIPRRECMQTLKRKKK